MITLAMGKGWARGLTEDTDPRVARNAAAHRGLRYLRRTPPDLWKRNRERGPIEWSAELAYATGLTATDGCLSSDGRHLSFGSEDRQLVETFVGCLRRTNAIRELKTRSGTPYYRVQFGDVRLYRWLQAVGLTPRKSLTLGPLQVSDEMLLPLARGLLDGDGSVLLFEYNGTGKARGKRYLAVRTHFVSASRPHIDWLRDRLRSRLGIQGCITYVHSKLGAGVWRLAYANRESARLLSELYADRDAPCLLRKRDNWDRFLALEAARKR